MINGGYWKGIMVSLGLSLWLKWLVPSLLHSVRLVYCFRHFIQHRGHKKHKNEVLPLSYSCPLAQPVQWELNLSSIRHRLCSPQRQVFDMCTIRDEQTGWQNKMVRDGARSRMSRNRHYIWTDVAPPCNVLPCDMFQWARSLAPRCNLPVWSARCTPSRGLTGKHVRTVRAGYAERKDRCLFVNLFW